MLGYEIPIGGKDTDVVGLFNHDTFARSLPETKANATLLWVTDAQQVSLAARYISSYETTRANPVAGYSQNIDSQLTFDFQYNYTLSMSDFDTRITLGVLNLTDEAPPQVWDSVNFSYDPRQHDGRGRVAYLGLKFGF
jgi:iron complex outermembrane receptor protein